MTSSPSRRTIGELVADGAVLAIQDGNHGGSHPKASEYVPAGIPFIMASDLEGGRVRLETCKRLTKARADRLRIGFAKTGDVLLTHKGTVGEVAIVPEVEDYLMLTPQVTYYRTDVEKLDPRYLAQAFRSPEFQQQLDSMSAQSTRPYVAISTQRHLSIPWVAMPTQRRIASILGAYDDLIEVNRRRVAVLEEMARTLFEEWFVRFRFPGHESVPLVDTPDGPLPQGWSMVTVSDVAEINRASLRPKAAPERVGYIDIASVSPGQIDEVTWMDFSDAPGRARRIVRDGSILWSNVRPNRRSHSLVLAPADGTVASTGFSVIDAHAVPFTYLYQWVTTEGFVGYLVGNATGAAYPAVTASTFERARLLLADDVLLNRFNAFAEPLVRQGHVLRQANERLAASRDLLLPRLLCGQLSLDIAERDLELAA